MRVLPLKRIEEALNILAKDAEVYAPLIRGTNSAFFKWIDDDEDELVLQTVNTYMAPKNIVIPQHEKKYAFKTIAHNAVTADAAPQIRDRIIFGIKPCDLKAIEAQDMIFLTGGYENEFYKSRRDKTAIIARACYQPGTACFCESMGVDRLNPAADVIIHDLGNQDFAWESKTPKGDDITARICNLLEDRDVTLPRPAEQKRKVNIEGLSVKLKSLYDSDVWDDLSSRCKVCGVCTNVCPNCYCFDAQVKVWGDEGYNFSCWDSCLYRDFAKTDDGQKPRPDNKERFRNRFLHKLEFFNERYGTPLCTGCGRCVVMCTNMANVIEVIQKLQDAKADS